MSDFRKDDQGKPRMSLVPSEAVRGAAYVMSYGAVKYADHNWRQPTYWTRFWDAADRHMRAWLEGEDFDESGLPTIDHAVCSLMMLSASIKRGIGVDDRYKGSDDGDRQRDSLRDGAGSVHWKEGGDTQEGADDEGLCENESGPALQMDCLRGGAGQPSGQGPNLALSPSPRSTFREVEGCVHCSSESPGVFSGGHMVCGICGSLRADCCPECRDKALKRSA